ncbi:MAG: hypothetical protein K8S97_02360, partial [Anaerolineae bacterium]|nr:hypothetical protein [Anaerolineae bacterium]
MTADAGVAEAINSAEIALTLSCPYCGASHDLVSDPRHPGHTPREIETMPYTRSKGEFEGQNAWSRIGLDFFAELINWEAIGILRVPDGDAELDVSYRLVLCPQCDYYFDVYLNWTPDRDLAVLWPHLFVRDADQQVARYTQISWTFGTLASVSQRFGLPHILTTALAALVLFLVSFAPRALIAYSRNPGDVLVEFWDLSAIPVLTRLVGAATLVLLAALSMGYVRFMHATEEFHTLFDVKRREHTTHWMNFTMSRTVGVQLNPHGYAMTQMSVLAGYPAVMILLATWFITHLRSTSGAFSAAANLGLLIGLLLLGYLVGAVQERRAGQARRILSQRARAQSGLPYWLASTLDWWVPVTGSRLRGALRGLLFWFTMAVLQLVLADVGRAEWVIDGVCEALFWAVIAYYIGTHIALAFGTSIYVLFQINRIPIKLHPLC